MTAYNWEKIMDMKTDFELQEIVNYNPDRLESEAILAAENEIKKRTENQSFNKEPEFPEKPIPDEKSQSLKKSITSLILFVAAFCFIFRWDLKYIERSARPNPVAMGLNYIPGGSMHFVRLFGDF